MRAVPDEVMRAAIRDKVLQDLRKLAEATSPTGAEG
jgi:hypothetical protein